MTFVYDSLGNRVRMQDGTGTYTSTYDALSRTKTMTDPADKTSTYTYDAVGNRIGMRDPDGGRFTYSYDAANQIDWLENPSGERTSFGYDDAGRRTLKQLANGTRASFTYDAGDNLRVLANLKSDGTTISSFDYAYDALGNRERVIEANGDLVTWTYDDTYQLTAEHRSGTNGYRHTFSYDAAGNRLVKNEDGSRTTYTYDVANQLETGQDSTGTTTYTFDAAGNQQLVEQPDGSRTTTTWDFENQPTLYELADGSRVTMSYNADNRRTEKDADAGTTKFLWEPVTDAYLMEADGTDTTQAVYTNEPVQYGRLVSQRRDSATNFYHFDALGSTRELSDSGEAVTDTYLYTAWGEEVTSTGTTENQFRWIGELGYYTDFETGQHYVRWRLYQPITARWISTDPMGSVDGPNLFTFVLNNPLNTTDVLGLTIQVFAFEGLGARWGINPQLKKHFRPIALKYAPCVKWNYTFTQGPFNTGRIAKQIEGIAKSFEPGCECCHPRIILLGYSRGGEDVFSILNVLHTLSEVQIDAALTVDPVFLTKNPIKIAFPGAAGTHETKDGTFGNYCQWASFFQRTDTNSFAGRFRIYGDRIKGAANAELHNLGPNGAHVRIAQDRRVLLTFDSILNDYLRAHGPCRISWTGRCPIKTCFCETRCCDMGL